MDKINELRQTYDISVICHNCRHVPPKMIDNDHGYPEASSHPKKFQVPKGTEVQKFLMGMTCENCGCEGFMGLK